MIRYNLTPVQQQTLAEDIREISIKLLNINFDTPENDQQLIRHHAYLRGSFDALRTVLEDEYPDPELKTIEE